MKFNFPLFTGCCHRAYSMVKDCPYSFDRVLSVFECYFKTYENATGGRPHPPIKIDQIARIIEIMPSIDNLGLSSAGGDIEAEDYEALIERHFQTQYRKCDYNINHFFSGDIRLMRYYEVFY